MGGLALFLNPVRAGEAATLALHLAQPEAVAVTVYDALGRRVRSETLALSDGPHRLPLDG